MTVDRSRLSLPCSKLAVPAPAPPANPWPLVLCLVGVDYFSTLAYLPSIAVEAAGPWAPVAAGAVVLVTFLLGAAGVLVRRRPVARRPRRHGAARRPDSRLARQARRAHAAGIRGGRLRDHAQPVAGRRRGPSDPQSARPALARAPARRTAQRRAPLVAAARRSAPAAGRPAGGRHAGAVDRLVRAAARCCRRGVSRRMLLVAAAAVVVLPGAHGARDRQRRWPTSRGTPRSGTAGSARPFAAPPRPTAARRRTTPGCGAACCASPCGRFRKWRSA